MKKYYVNKTFPYFHTPLYYIRYKTRDGITFETLKLGVLTKIKIKIKLDFKSEKKWNLKQKMWEQKLFLNIYLYSLWVNGKVIRKIKFIW